MRTPFTKGILPWLARRLIVMDLGSSHIKILLAEDAFGQIRFLEHQLIDLQEEGLLSLEEINRHLQKTVREWGDHPVALAIPQHLCLSHLVDLPRVGEGEVKHLIEQETLNLSGLSESSIVYDYYRLKPYGRHVNPFWVTISREQEIQNQINRLVVEDQEPTICEVTSVANALVAAYLSDPAPAARMVLADLGATSTVVAIVDHGQGVYATSFPIGGESFTGAIASLKKCSFEEAELLKRSEDVFQGPNPLHGFLAVVDIWHKDLEKILREWEEDNPELKSSNQPFHIRLSGGGARQPGLRNYLQTHSVFEFQSWPEKAAKGAVLPMDRFAVACGLALQSFKKHRRTASLLPQTCRAFKHRQRQLMAANWAGAGLLFLLALLLLAGAGQKLLLAYHNGALVADAEAALSQAQGVETLIQQRELNYGDILPILDHQKQTDDLLCTLQILQQIREKKDLWFVLLADQRSYFSGSVYAAPELGQTNLPILMIASNRTEAPAGFIAQLCIPEKSGDASKVLIELVTELKKEKLFRNVDILTHSLIRTNWVDPKLLLPDRTFTLTLDLAQKEAPRPLWRSKSATNPPSLPRQSP